MDNIMLNVAVHIQQLPPEQWQQYRSFRLEAVKMDPQAFGNSHEEELAFTETQWQTFIRNMYFAMVDNQIIGMIGLLTNTSVRNKHRADMVSFWVHPAYRNCGIGKALIKHVQSIAYQKEIRKIHLHVMTTQHAAIELYKKTGFNIVGTLRDYSCIDNVFLDATVMEWLNSDIKFYRDNP